MFSHLATLARPAQWWLAELGKTGRQSGARGGQPCVARIARLTAELKPHAVRVSSNEVAVFERLVKRR